MYLFFVAAKKRNEESVPLVECNECGKVLRKKYLYRHLRMHTGAFECKKCNKRFVEKSYFEQHMNLHTGTQPFECQACDKKFYWLKSYKTHMKNHGGNESYLFFTKP